MFLPNALAVSGSSFESPLIEQIKTNCTLVFDNERRSKEITALMKKMLLKGYRVCLWREGLNFKDINEGILSGLTSDQIRIIIDEDAVQGTAGLVKFALWKK